MIIFEDNPNSPLSVLLKRYLKDNVCFASGNRELEKVIMKYMNNEKIVCFIDYVYDNPETLKLYSKLLYYYGDSITIVRIPCIELYAYLLLRNYKIKQEFINAKDDILLYCIGLLKDMPKYKYNYNSFEKYIKSLTEIRPSCINTSSSSNNKGKFYISDCNCGDKYCSLVTRDISAIEKSMFVCASLRIKSILYMDNRYLDLDSSYEMLLDSFYERMRLYITRYKLDEL